MREPEAVFWVYGFPILMTLGAGHRVSQSAGRADRRRRRGRARRPKRPTRRSRSRRAPSGSRRSVLSEEEARRRLRTGRTDLVVVPMRRPTPTAGRSTSTASIRRGRRACSRGARSTISCSGRPGGEDVAEVKLVAGRRAGRPVHRLSRAGPAGHEPDGRRACGASALSPSTCGVRKLLKRFLATPMKKSRLPGGVMVSRMLFMVPEVLILLVFARYAFGVVIHGSLLAVVVLDPAGGGDVLRDRPAGRQPGEDDRSGLGPDEPGDGADVDFLGHLLFVGAVSRSRSSRSSS